MVVRRHKLDMAIQEDFCLLGLVADEPDYKLCWMINQSLGFSFKKQEDLNLFHKKLQDNQFFSLFSYTEEDTLLTYRIIRNRSEKGYYLEELKNLDYLVHIQGELSTNRIQSFIQRVSAIPSVRMCVPVELKKIRNSERLLLW
jgi:hypothetical protein